MGAKPDCLPALPLVSLHAAREGGFVMFNVKDVRYPEGYFALQAIRDAVGVEFPAIKEVYVTETTKVEKTEHTETQEQHVEARPLTNVAITGATPTVTETKTETKVETKEDDGA